MHTMKPTDLFNLAIRLLGLVFVYLGFRAVPVAFFDKGRSLLFVACYFAVAWWLIGGARLLMQRAYPTAGAEPQSGGEIAGGAGAKGGV
jgi:hypothetical protein